jgi:Txe/YoeB family toxin of Txe-Axe toxin-antitoxin module
MNITVYSRNRLYETFSKWDVPRDFADPMANYLVYGYEPGSCFTAVLANDFYAAMQSSHPANTVETFKALVGWIRGTLPIESYGSYQAVKHWLKLEEDDRRRVLENHQLIYTSKQEVIKILKSEITQEPVLY